MQNSEVAAHGFMKDIKSVLTGALTAMVSGVNTDDMDSDDSSMFKCPCGKQNGKYKNEL